jgi:hypothetical protein
MSAKDHDSEAESDILEGVDSDSVEFLHDDTDDPDEVTLFSPGADRIATEWITADVCTAVALDDAR